jgi:hypothetical protein
VESLVVTVPDALPGDPAAMRGYAADLMAESGRLDDVRANVDVAARTPVFKGPAGDRFRSDTGDCCNRLGGHGDDVRQLAGRIRAAADEVEASQRARQAALDQLALERQQARAAVGGS